jgi:hypothetical protein
MRCFVVPNGLTSGMDFSGADRVMSSLEEVRVVLFPELGEDRGDTTGGNGYVR